MKIVRDFISGLPAVAFSPLVLLTYVRAGMAGPGRGAFAHRRGAQRTADPVHYGAADLRPRPRRGQVRDGGGGG